MKWNKFTSPTLNGRQVKERELHNNLKINKVQKSSIAVLYPTHSISNEIERIVRLQIRNVSVIWVDLFIS